MSAVYPAVKLEHMYVDNAAMQLTLRPAQFDVMLSSNMFGDILSDAAAAQVGSILSATMMLRDAFGLSLEADWVEQSLQRVLAGGYRTPDIAEPGAPPVGGSVFTEILREEMQRTFEHAERYGWGV